MGQTILGGGFGHLQYAQGDLLGVAERHLAANQVGVVRVQPGSHAGHRQVVPGEHGQVRVLFAAPVGYEDAAEVPFVARDLLQ